MKKITSVTTRFKSYGHFEITTFWIDDNYGETYAKTITTNTRAVDGLDGYEKTLARECLSVNGYDINEFDLSQLLDLLID